MRISKTRHLGLLNHRASLERASSSAATAPTFKFEDGEFSPRDFVSLLLHIDAEIEHALMIQYLYAAYSLGGDQVPSNRRDQVRGWQEIILGIAKEEMGHLLSVQNVLRLIGSPLNLDREDYPWDVPFYPFPFSLEPLTLDSLAKYVYAESPTDWSGDLQKEIAARVARSTPSPHRVGELFEALIERVENPAYLHESTFQADTLPFQASWDDWGRGYQDGKRGNASGANPPGSPSLLVKSVISRDEAVIALKGIRDQGEAPQSDSTDEPSHFARFLKIYQEMKERESEGWSPSKPIATNPYVSFDPTMSPGSETAASVKTSPITDPKTRLWASLHNLRYRMLLTYLSHIFTLPAPPLNTEIRTPRGLVIHATFGEMYNLRALADLLTQLPLGDPQQPTLRAGPPFQMPYSLSSPLGEPNRWRIHLDLLQAAHRLIEQILAVAPKEQHRFLHTMRETDRQMQLAARRVLTAHMES